LDEHFMALERELTRAGRRQRDAILVGLDLLGDADAQDARTLACGATLQIEQQTGDRLRVLELAEPRCDLPGRPALDGDGLVLVDRDDRDGARMLDDLALVRAPALDGDADQRAVVHAARLVGCHASHGRVCFVKRSRRTAPTQNARLYGVRSRGSAVGMRTKRWQFSRTA